jgi:hypothetical protein
LSPGTSFAEGGNSRYAKNEVNRLSFGESMTLIRLCRASIYASVLTLAACGGVESTSHPEEAGTNDDHRAAPSNDASGPIAKDASGPSDVNQAVPDSALQEASTSNDCMSLCEAKAASCGAPSGEATMDCETVCGKSPTPSQIECLETSTCESLAASFEKTGTACGVGVTDGG